MLLFLHFFYYPIFSLPWGVGFGASVEAQGHYSEQLQGDTAKPFLGFHLLHREIINNELILSPEWKQAEETLVYDRQCTTRFKAKQSEVQRKTKGFQTNEVIHISKLINVYFHSTVNSPALSDYLIWHKPWVSTAWLPPTWWRVVWSPVI